MKCLPALVESWCALISNSHSIPRGVESVMCQLVQGVVEHAQEWGKGITLTIKFE